MTVITIVPTLVHVAGFAPREAIVASLVVVGVAAAAGALLHGRHGALDVRVAAWFGGLGAVGAMAGARVGRGLPAALGVGFLTGLLGVGGGFLIVPALALVLRLPMARAVGTSLAVIAINCAAGLVAAATALDPAHVVVTAVFAGLTLLGTLAGARTVSRTRPEVLRRAFGVLVVAVGVYTGAAALI